MKKNPKENLDEWVNSLPDSSYTTTSESNIKFEEKSAIPSSTQIALKVRLHLLSGKIILQQQIR